MQQLQEENLRLQEQLQLQLQRKMYEQSDMYEQQQQLRTAIMNAMHPPRISSVVFNSRPSNQSFIDFIQQAPPPAVSMQVENIASNNCDDDAVMVAESKKQQSVNTQANEMQEQTKKDKPRSRSQTAKMNQRESAVFTTPSHADIMNEMIKHPFRRSSFLQVSQAQIQRTTTQTDDEHETSMSQTLEMRGAQALHNLEDGHFDINQFIDIHGPNSFGHSSTIKTTVHKSNDNEQTETASMEHDGAVPSTSEQRNIPSTSEKRIMAIAGGCVKRTPKKPTVRDLFGEKRKKANSEMSLALVKKMATLSIIENFVPAKATTPLEIKISEHLAKFAWYHKVKDGENINDMITDMQRYDAKLIAVIENEVDDSVWKKGIYVLHVCQMPFRISCHCGLMNRKKFEKVSQNLD